MPILWGLMASAAQFCMAQGEEEEVLFQADDASRGSLKMATPGFLPLYTHFFQGFSNRWYGTCMEPAVLVV